MAWARSRPETSPTGWADGLTLVSSVTLFSIGSAICATAGGVGLFGCGRFIADLGLGRLMPLCLAMAMEFAPPRRTALTTGLLMTSYHVGGMAATGLGLALAPAAGWRWVFWAGVLPGVIAVPLLLKLLPESPGVLLARGEWDRAPAVADHYGLPWPTVVAAPAAGARGRLPRCGHCSTPRRAGRLRCSGARLLLRSAVGVRRGHLAAAGACTSPRTPWTAPSTSCPATGPPPSPGSPRPAAPEGVVKLAGLITHVQRKTTKQGKTWAVVRLTDRDGAMEFLCFSATYTLVQHALMPDRSLSKAASTNATGTSASAARNSPYWTYRPPREAGSRRTAMRHTASPPEATRV